VLTRDFYRPAIEDAMHQLYLPALRFEFVGVRHVPWWMPGLDVYPYYACWQWNAWLRAKRLHREHPFDIVHHITYACFRHPSYLYLLRGARFIFGPVGGGERSPRALRVSMSRNGKRREALRDLANLLPYFDPFWQSMLRHCARIVVKTEETRACLPRKSRERAVVCLENMVTEQPCLAGETGRVPPLKLLYAGRMLPLKGLHLALRAMALVVDRERAELTIVGSGPEETRLKAEARRLTLEHFVHFVPWMPKSEVLGLYSTHDALLFPSLHDSGGTVVMEAIAHGRPVICLDLGGPPVTVDEHCARIVSTRGKTEDQVIQGMADAILEFVRMNSGDWEAMRRAAVRRAQFYAPDKVIARVYGPLIEPGIGGFQVAKPLQTMQTPKNGDAHASAPAVWVCIAVFNRIHFTRKCLELLFRQTYPKVKIVVVDDGSSDGTSALVRAEYPEVVLLRGDGSLYWTGAMHAGVAHILAHAAPNDYTLLLNDDLIFAPDLVEKLLDTAKRFPQSLIQAVESCADDPDLIWQGGVTINWWTAKHRRLNYHRRLSEFPSGYFERSDYLTGRGVLAPMEVFRTIGNFDLSYKQYGDPEFTRRAAKHGYGLIVTYDVPVLSYAKGGNLNETESYSLSDLRRYYFGILSNARLTNRWKNATGMTDSWVQAFVFFAFDIVRITGHFAKRLKVRSPLIP